MNNTETGNSDQKDPDFLVPKDLTHDGDSRIEKVSGIAVESKSIGIVSPENDADSKFADEVHIDENQALQQSLQGAVVLNSTSKDNLTSEKNGSSTEEGRSGSTSIHLQEYTFPNILSLQNLQSKGSVFQNLPWRNRKEEALKKTVDNLRLQKNQNYHSVQLPAAPYPLLPCRNQIENMINKLDKEINDKKIELNSLLQQKRRAKMKEIRPIKDLNPNYNIRNCHSCIISQTVIDDVKRANQQKARITHQRNVIGTQVSQMVNHIHDYPNYKESPLKILEPIANQVFVQKDLEYIHNDNLVAQYIERLDHWSKESVKLTQYHKQLKASVNHWPPEFNIQPLKTTDPAVLLPLCAPDQPMYNTEEDREAFLYFDENSLVEDPVLEHSRYKARVSWSDEEKRIFYERYAQHPREFKKIANGLPSKTIKDVIEYYHIYRIKLNLKALEVAARHKGTHKRMISEGNVRK